MPKKNQRLQVVLPARMSLIQNAFAGLEIAVLDFPYQDAIDEFTKGLKQVLRKDQLEPWQYPPYRLLNSAIVACASTVVHGFEKYGQYSSIVRRMLAVGKPIYNQSNSVIGSTLQYPLEEQIAQLIRAWIQVWGQQPWIKRHIENEARGLWRNLEQSLDAQPQTRWRRIEPEFLVADINAETGLAFNAIPSLLATLLHGEISIIGQQKKEVKWRKAQDIPNRLCVVSEPLPISFMRKRGYTEELGDGFFAYKLEFQIHTQMGRTEPWIHVFLHCQRYAHLPLTRNTRGNDLLYLLV